MRLWRNLKNSYRNQTKQRRSKDVLFIFRTIVSIYFSIYFSCFFSIYLSIYMLSIFLSFFFLLFLFFVSGLLTAVRSVALPAVAAATGRCALEKVATALSDSSAALTDAAMVGELWTAQNNTQDAHTGFVRAYGPKSMFCENIEATRERLAIRPANIPFLDVIHRYLEAFVATVGSPLHISSHRDFEAAAPKDLQGISPGIHGTTTLIILVYLFGYFAGPAVGRRHHTNSRAPSQKTNRIYPLFTLAPAPFWEFRRKRLALNEAFGPPRLFFRIPRQGSFVPSSNSMRFLDGRGSVGADSASSPNISWFFISYDLRRFCLLVVQVSRRRSFESVATRCEKRFTTCWLWTSDLSESNAITSMRCKDASRVRWEDKSISTTMRRVSSPVWSLR